jgi:hypothetical protein
MEMGGATVPPSEPDPGEEKNGISPIELGPTAPHGVTPLDAGGAANQGKAASIGEVLSGAGAAIAGDKTGTAFGSAGSAGNGEAAPIATVDSTQRLVAIACGSFSQAARVPRHGSQRQVRRSNIIKCTGWSPWVSDGQAPKWGTDGGRKFISFLR